MSRERAEDQERLALQLSDDVEFHRREMLARRVGSAALFALLLAGLAGFFGAGPASHAQARSSDGTLRVGYERFVRANAPTALRMRVPASSAVAGTVHIWLDRAFAQKVALEEMLPEPKRTTAAADSVVLDIAVAGADTVELVLRYRPQSLGVLAASAGAGGGTVRFRQFVYP